jgi:hypothetical protein
MCAYLNLASNNRERCIEQKRESIEIKAVIYGRDNWCVKNGRRRLEKLLEGAYTGAKYEGGTASGWLKPV